MSAPQPTLGIRPAVFVHHEDGRLTPMLSFCAEDGSVFFSIEAQHAELIIENVRAAAVQATLSVDQMRAGFEAAPGLMMAQAEGRA